MTPTRERPLYIGVARVSTRRQADEGHSLDTQDEQLYAEAERRGVDLDVVVAPARTGKKMSRELRGVLARLANHEADGLIAAKVDRVARRVLDTVAIMERARREGWNLVILQPDLDLSRWQDRAMLHMLATFAEVESELNGERVRDNLATARDRGSRIGRPSSVPDDVARRIRRERTRDRDHSLTAIARRLTADGIPTPSGLPTWGPSSVQSILARTGGDPRPSAPRRKRVTA